MLHIDGLSSVALIYVIHLIHFCLLQINLPSSLISSLDVAFNDDHHKSSRRSFPENLGSGSTPLTPKVLLFIFLSSFI